MLNSYNSDPHSDILFHRQNQQQQHKVNYRFQAMYELDKHWWNYYYMDLKQQTYDYQHPVQTRLL